MLRILAIALIFSFFGPAASDADPLDEATIEKINTASIEQNLGLIEHPGFRLFLRWNGLNIRAEGAAAIDPRAEQIVTDLYTFEGSVKDMMFGPPPTDFEIKDKTQQFDRIEAALERSEAGLEPYPSIGAGQPPTLSDDSMVDSQFEQHEFLTQTVDVQLLVRAQLLDTLYSNIIWSDLINLEIEPLWDRFSVCMALNSLYKVKIRQGDALSSLERIMFRDNLATAETHLIEMWRQPDWKLADEEANQTYQIGLPLGDIFPDGFESGEVSPWCDPPSDVANDDGEAYTGGQGSDDLTAFLGPDGILRGSREPTRGEKIGERWYSALQRAERLRANNPAAEEIVDELKGIEPTIRKFADGSFTPDDFEFEENSRSLNNFDRRLDELEAFLRSPPPRSRVPFIQTDDLEIESEDEAAVDRFNQLKLKRHSYLLRATQLASNSSEAAQILEQIKALDVEVSKQARNLFDTTEQEHQALMDKFEAIGPALDRIEKDITPEPTPLESEGTTSDQTNEEVGAIYREPATQNVSIEGAVGYVIADGPQTGFGTNITDGETFIGETPETLEGFGVEGTLSRALGDGSLSFAARYVQVDGDNTETVAPNGDTVGIVFDQGLNDPASPTPITGINLGPSGATVHSDAEMQRVSIAARYSQRFDDSDTEYFFGARADFTSADYESTYTSSLFLDSINTNFDQSVEELHIGPEVGIASSWQVGGGFGLHVDAAVSALYRDAELDSNFALNCDFCPASGQALRSTINDSDDGWTGGVEASIGLSYTLDSGQTVGVRLTGEYVDEVASVENESTGDAVLAGGATRLGTDSRTVWGLDAFWTF